MAIRLELPQVREEHGFKRTVCDCAFCRVPCRYIPGGLHPSDLARLCPAGQDVFIWAEEHLRALTHHPYPTLVPARNSDGQCHWLFDGKCAVHENSPFGCAFFDMHMTEAEVEERRAAVVRARKEDAAAGGLHYRVWVHLCRKGLTGRPADRGALKDELRALGRRVRL